MAALPIMFADTFDAFDADSVLRVGGYADMGHGRWFDGVSWVQREVRRNGRVMLMPVDPPLGDGERANGPDYRVKP